jgi:hypothetical protein
MASERFELRNMEIYEKRIRGASLASLAGEYGLTDASISNICAEVRRTLPERSREELIAASLDQLEFLREKVLELVNMEGAPVTVGQQGDILREPSEDGDGEIVRDYSLRTRAIAEAHKLNQTFAKRLGLDAPTESVVKASVQYEVVGLDPEALT